jgi:hemerythrin-like domain-containing protein
MKRSAALVPLGHDHHRALEAALRLRRATGETLADALEGFREFWDHHQEKRHFEIEEELVLPRLAGDEQWDGMAGRIRREHERIRTLAEVVGTVEEAHVLGELLNDHVRFEERELFELLESRLDADELHRLGEEIEAARPRR